MRSSVVLWVLFLGLDTSCSYLRAQDKEAKKQDDQKEFVVELGNGVRMSFVRIPAGKFWMGSPTTEIERRSDEEQHEVEITKEFYLGKFAVTQEQYAAIVSQNPSYFSKNGRDKESHRRVAEMDTREFPVESVSWHDAQKFCQKLSEKENARGRAYRLPTEAEWEFACRAGASSKDTAPFYLADGPVFSISSRNANFDGKYPYSGADKADSLGRTTKVGTFAPNRLGLFDMHGNLSQWCQDYYGPYSKLSTTKDPVQNEKQGEDRRIYRGGSWGNPGHSCRAANRFKGAPENRYDTVGFRVVLTLLP